MSINIAATIEHTLLKPDVSRSEIKQLCAEAIEHKFSGVCIPPYFVKTAKDCLEDYPIKVITVIGFPMGYSSTPAKVEEVKRAFDEGADEVDVVLNIAAVKDKNWTYVKNDIESVVIASHIKGKIVKIILETGLLEDEEIQKVCEIANQSEVNYLKTSTGFHGTGATLPIVKKLKSLSGAGVKIKASGGIKTKEMALELIEAGADKIGTSSSIALIGE